MHRYLGIAAGIISLTVALPASAVQVFHGQDDGTGPGDSFSSSRAAQAQFLTAASNYGHVTTNGFETLALGVHLPIPLNGLDIYTTAGDYGPGMSGITDIEIDGRYGFNTTIGGANWLGFPDLYQSDAFFIFENPTNSFGFFTTGLQSQYTASLSFTLLDGSELTFDLPVNVDGGVSFFGLVDSGGFTQAVLSQNNSGGFVDAWGIDDISYNIAGAVPEPASWALMIAGFGMVGFASRRRQLQSRLS